MTQPLNSSVAGKPSYDWSALIDELNRRLHLLRATPREVVYLGRGSRRRFPGSGGPRISTPLTNSSPRPPGSIGPSV